MCKINAVILSASGRAQDDSNIYISKGYVAREEAMAGRKDVRIFTALLLKLPTWKNKVNV